MLLAILAFSLAAGHLLLLVAATGAVLLGTLYPLVLDALGLGRSRSAPVLQRVFVPLMVPLNCS